MVVGEYQEEAEHSVNGDGDEEHGPATCARNVVLFNANHLLW